MDDTSYEEPYEVFQTSSVFEFLSDLWHGLVDFVRRVTERRDNVEMLA